MRFRGVVYGNGWPDSFASLPKNESRCVHILEKAKDLRTGNNLVVSRGDDVVLDAESSFGRELVYSPEPVVDTGKEGYLFAVICEGLLRNAYAFFLR